MGFVVTVWWDPRHSPCSISVSHTPEISPSLFLGRRGRRSHLLKLLLAEWGIVPVLPWRSKNPSRPLQCPVGTLFLLGLVKWDLCATISLTGNCCHREDTNLTKRLKRQGLNINKRTVATRGPRKGRNHTMLGRAST